MYKCAVFMIGNRVGLVGQARSISTKNLEEVAEMR